jgi:hypothetical protein
MKVFVVLLLAVTCHVGDLIWNDERVEISISGTFNSTKDCLERLRPVLSAGHNLRKLRQNIFAIEPE